MPAVANSGGESFVYRFDPDTSSFVFTFTIPTDNASPWDVVVVSGAGHEEVWFTEAGADRIGRLTYTDTNDYAFREYTLTVSSRPLNLVSGGGFIWFTEAGGDRIGRLDPTTGQIDEFEVTAGSYPADLDYAPDGSIWFTEMMADQIARLVITSTDDYAVTEYSTSSLSGGRPYGIVVDGKGVYFAQMVNDRVTRFTPPDSWVHIHSLVSDVPNEPYALVLDGSGRLWGTERAGNRVSEFVVGTFPIVVPYSLTPTNSLPTSLVADANNHLWFTQWQAGQIGHLIPGGNPQKNYYPMPLAGLTPTGIATDSAGSIWVLASRPYRIHLPVVIRS
jgi:virginiamycin B lyase